jgi:hypothetical protein
VAAVRCGARRTGLGRNGQHSPVLAVRREVGIPVDENRAGDQPSPLEELGSPNQGLPRVWSTSQMSCYEWESGTVLLPSAEVARFRKTMNAAAETERDALCDLAGKAWAAVKSTPVKQRQAATARWLTERYRQQVGNSGNGSNWWERAYAVESLFRASGGKKPGEKDLAASGFARATSRTRMWEWSEASVMLDGRTVLWTVPENNHAVEHARGSWLGVALFGFLGSVLWTRGSGSEGFVGNNEYNRDSMSDGGGGNYVTVRFGPLGDVALGRVLAGPWV